MYNAEEYIGECLDSLLVQTFQDFEVIVVNDCSTDKSVKIVESYAPKFDGRLTLAHMERNSGGCAMPRNKGLSISKGEYVQFVDSDDTLVSTALEELYELARNYNADVVYCEKYFMSTGVGEDFVKNIHPADSRIQRPPFVDKPTIETEDLSERVKELFDGRFLVTAWSKFVRRDLLTEHEMLFPYIAPAEDNVWTYVLIFHAKKFLRVPNLVYVRRMREDSITGTKRTPQQIMKFLLNPLLYGLKELDDMLRQNEFFQANPQQHHDILQWFAEKRCEMVARNSEKLSSVEIYETIKKEYGDKLGEYGVLISMLCTLLCTLRTKHLNDAKKLKKLKKADTIARERITELETELKSMKHCLEVLRGT
ncbi:MAG: glycosyltransferase [Selenomonadaceae bacterium]|nr:glycosyltransferase [Selenomonadaceae bacterium]